MKRIVEEGLNKIMEVEAPKYRLYGHIHSHITNNLSQNEDML